MLPDCLKQLISLLQEIPAIGPKTAERYALHIINNFNHSKLDLLSKSLQEIKQLKRCNQCNLLTNKDICDYCMSHISSDTLLIVSKDQDIIQINNTKQYSGLFYNLKGLIDFKKAIGPKELNLEGLINKIKQNQNLKEIILALDSTVEGEVTSNYLTTKLKEELPNIIISKIAFGIPFGSDLKYADQYTLGFSIINRKKL